MTGIRPYSILFIISLMTAIVLCSHPGIADSSIYLSIKDDEGPVGDAIVAVVVGGCTYTDTTGYDGRASFTIPEGKYTFRVFRDGYQDMSVEAIVGVDDVVNVMLSRVYYVSGTVIDASTGTPLKDVGIEVVDRDSRASYKGSTDKNGIFNIRTPNGDYEINAHADGYRITTVDNRGNGYKVNNGSIYVGYIPLIAVNSDNTWNANGVRLSTDFPGKTININGEAIFDVTVSNNGYIDNTYELAVKEAPPGWDVRFISGGDIVNRIYVEDKKDKTVKVRVIPDSEGNHTITITASAPNDQSSLKLYVDTISYGHGLDLECPGTFDMNTGSGRNIGVVVKNNGSSVLTNVSIDISQGDMPQSMEARVLTDRLAELAPGESKEFVIQLSARDSASGGKEKIPLHAVSDQLQSDDKYIEVNLVKGNMFIVVGLAIVVIATIAIGFVLWVFRK